MVLLLLDEGADVLTVDPAFDDDESGDEEIDDAEPEVAADADVVVLDAVLVARPA